VDPHGHPIPDKNGKINEIKQRPLSTCELSKKYTVQSVKDGSPAFLQYLDKLGIYIKATLVITDRIDFDNSLELIIDNKNKAFISQVAAENLLVTE
jgi:DtxR family Mn-dependent transcriptional regulator